MEDFLRRVLPDGGQYVVAAIAGASGAREVRGLQTITAVAHAAQRLSTQPVNVYYAVGSYGADRKSPLAKRCLFVDLDSKSFPTKQDAIKGLVNWCRAACFPLPSIFVDSGRGIHAYWTFDRDLPVEQWKPIAEALKASCLAAGFQIDPTVTADAARILRMPGTLNHKETPPVPCRLLKDTGVNYEPAALLQSLQPASGLDTVAGASVGSLAKLAAMVGADDLGSVPALSSYPQVPYYATEIAEKCGVMKEAVETGGRDHAEPLWRHLMALLSFCDDGERLVHEISQGHPQYNQGQTDAKWALIQKDKAAGKLKPILCKTFATYKNSICAGCPYNGRINTPMTLGKLESTSYLPHNYRMADYGVEKLAKKGDGEVPDLWITVFPYRISDVEILDPGAKMPKAVRAIYSAKTEVKRIDFENILLAAGTNEGLGVLFATEGLHLNTHHLTEFKLIMTSWLRKMQDTKAAVSVELNGLGWGKRGGKHAFVAGPYVFMGDGKRYDFYTQDHDALRSYIPVGDMASWQKCVNTLLQDPRQAVVTTLLTAFSAPLVSFAEVKGLTYSLYSAKSGTGKSAVLKTAQSVWGHPVQGMSQLNDTENAVIRGLGFLNTIPAYWDELRETGSFGNFVKMLFTLGQGREKARLTSSIRQQSRGTWDTLITIASNERIVDHIDEHVRNSDAGRLRVFEVVMPNMIGPRDPEFSRNETALSKNYGHAGQIYGKYLAEHRDEAAELVRKYTEVIRKSAGGSGERFWTAFVAITMAAAVLVERAGLFIVDQPRLQQYLLQQLAMQRGGVAAEYQTPTDAATQSVFEFVSANRPRMLLVETFNGNGMSKYGNILTPSNQLPREDIYILKAVNDKKLRIKRNSWRYWVRTQLKNSPSTFEQELLAKGVLKVRSSLNAGIQAASDARVDCLEIDLLSPHFAALQDQ